MIYPKNLEQKLGFDQIRELLKQECQGPLGQAYIDKMRFCNDWELILKLINQTAEFQKLINQGEVFPSGNFIDANPYLNKIKPEGAFLSPEEFRELKVSLFTITACLEFIDKKTDAEIPYLKELRKEVELDGGIYRAVDTIIDDRGQIRDDASIELREIRKRLLGEQARIRKELDKILKHLQKEGFTDQDTAITIRGGRMVVPVFAEHKRKVKGFVHDESATGQTVFIEPAEVLEINNEIKELEYQERREIIRILTKLTDYIRPFIPELRRAYTFSGLIDFIRAKAKFANQIEALKPTVEKKQVIKWIRAKHPLLYLSHKKQDKPIVPQSIHLDHQKRILVISGPNAGGKSVCLKTVGLIQYMFQCGLLVPVDEGSTLGFFDDLFIDIGDEQSLENDLSTYSSHLTNMRHFLNFAGKRSLILIDEFGTGTDPQFGGAIAEAVLDGLNKLRTFGVVTTHYSNLKTYAENTEGVINGAMRFDVQKLEPLYELEIGKPGSSFAFEIATKIGLPKDIIQASKDKLGTSQVSFDKMLRDLEVEKNKVREQSRRLQSKEQKLENTLNQYRELKDYLEQNKKKLLNDAKKEAKQLLLDTNQKIEATIREIKESQADKAKTRQLREELERLKEKIKPESEVLEDTPDVEVVGGEIKEGDLVRIKDSGAVGEVVAIKAKDAEIMIGDLKSNIKLSRLEKITRKDFRKQVLSNSSSFKGLDLNEKIAAFSPNLDLRGKRGEEALFEVDSLIDSAIIFGAKELRIVHGKGDGILRTLIR
ncbi:MAG TPA: Smr/MutS family protein, partial [Cytophagaceae bacterium]